MMRQRLLHKLKYVYLSDKVNCSLKSFSLQLKWGRVNCSAVGATELGADRNFSALYRGRGTSEGIGSDKCVSADLRHYVIFLPPTVFLPGAKV